MTADNASALEAIRYHNGSLYVLNQLLLPFRSEYEQVTTVQDGARAIKEMRVRGAPAIAIVAILSLAVDLTSRTHTEGELRLTTVESAVTFVDHSLSLLRQSRPTAVNLFDACDKVAKIIADKSTKAKDSVELSDALNVFATTMYEQDLADNHAIGTHGRMYLQSRQSQSRPLRILTICNTGSLATAGWGTALGIVRELHQKGLLEQVYALETRPYNQGSRLTAFELVHDNIPSTLICDSMAASLLQRERIDAIIVGADRVAANGDTANKIGTFQLAILAKHFGVDFLVAAPSTSIDLSTASGQDIVIEERAALEMTQVRGRLVDGTKDIGQMAVVEVAAPGITVWNPAFDITPANLISGIVTEKGVATKSGNGEGYHLQAFLKTYKC